MLIKMKNVSVSLQNCYGIKKLDFCFDFLKSHSYAIYAPNGVMKTSFAKVFKDLSLGVESKDFVFPERTSRRVIKDDKNLDIEPNKIFVIEPYNEMFNSDKLSTLLVKQELKEEYDSAYKEVEDEKKNFIKKLKNISQSSDCEFEFISTFTESESDNFFILLERISSSLDGKQQKFEFRYNDIFDKKGSVEKFLNTHRDSLDSYIKNYDSLISKSNFFKKTKHTFGTYQANKILDSISDGSFFEAGHSLFLANETKLKSSEELKGLIESEINKIVKDTSLKTVFDKIDKAIGSSIELRSFKSVIENNNLLLIELLDYKKFREKVWIGYMDALRTDVVTFLQFYKLRKTRLEEIVEKAKKEVTQWEKSIKEFNERFIGLPFRLSIKNREDVMLQISKPTVEFIFCDSNDKKIFKKEELLMVLSQGERRALYLLNIVFEVQARIKAHQETLFIIDDIADSFDYKNKYAILQYLEDISKNPLFCQIVLTHNFDFLRTLESREIVPYSNCLFSFKSNDHIFLERATGGIKNPFINDWKIHLDDDKKLIASIPFVRNIIEYTIGESCGEYQKLTSLLHWKADSESLLIEDLQPIFGKVISDMFFPSKDLKLKAVDKIFLVAEDALKASEGVNLEYKIVLSIAIRLKAEKYAIRKINNKSFVDQISKNQTRELIEKYKEMFKTDVNNIDLLEQVNLMTPENIHLNSFMYEPILDLGDSHLRDLYNKVKLL